MVLQVYHSLAGSHGCDIHAVTEWLRAVFGVEEGGFQTGVGGMLQRSGRGINQILSKKRQVRLRVRVRVRVRVGQKDSATKETVV